MKVQGGELLCCENEGQEGKERGGLPLGNPAPSLGSSQDMIGQCSLTGNSLDRFSPCFVTTTALFREHTLSSSGVLGDPPHAGREAVIRGSCGGPLHCCHWGRGCSANPFLGRSGT